MPQVQFINTQAMDPSAASLDQQLMLQRQSQLAQMLQEQANTPVAPVSPGAPISWTQGLAKMFQGWAAGKANAKEREMTRDYILGQNAALDRVFGTQPQGGGAASGSAPPSAPPAAPPQLAQPGDTGTLPPGEQGPTMLIKRDPGQTLSDALGQPPAGAQQQGAPASRPMLPSLTGDSTKDRMIAGQVGLPKYIEMAVGQNTDLTKTLMAAGIDPKSPQGIRMILANLQKQNYIAPAEVRPGTTALGPDGKPIFYNPQVPEGAMPTWGPNGVPTQVSMLPGATGAIQSSDQASALGKTLGGVVQVPQRGGGTMPQIGAGYFGPQAGAPNAGPPGAPQGSPQMAPAPRPAPAAGAGAPQQPPATPQQDPRYWAGLPTYRPPQGVGPQSTTDEADAKQVVEKRGELFTSYGQAAQLSDERQRNNTLALQALGSATTGPWADRSNVVRGVLNQFGLLGEGSEKALTETTELGKYLNNNALAKAKQTFGGGRLTNTDVTMAIEKPGTPFPSGESVAFW
jgi:hypothetical protein